MSRPSETDDALPLLEGQELIYTGAKGRRPVHVERNRRKLTERFADVGRESLTDEELLELLLFRSLPHCDVKPVAERLLSGFGDIHRVLSAPTARLSEVRGVGDAVAQDLKLIEAATHRMAKARVFQSSIISSWDALIDYCRTSMSHLETEHVRVLYLDRRNSLIADEEQGRGTVDHVPVYPREVVKRALELNASALIVVHNHPSGDPTPSQSDIDMTQQIQSAAEALGLTVHDHLIIGKSDEFSFRSAGYL